MKKSLTIFASLLFFFSTTAQEKKEENFNVGLKAQAGLISFVGFEGEYILNRDRKHINSLLLNLGGNAMKINTDYGNTVGNGFEIGVGRRSYFNNKSLVQGLYIDYNLNYGSIKFDDKLTYNNASFKIDGRFKYVSILNYSVGYKLLLLKKIIVEPSASVRYNIEIKGKGFIDNRDVNNFLFNAGLRLGYSF